MPQTHLVRLPVAGLSPILISAVLQGNLSAQSPVLVPPSLPPHPSSIVQDYRYQYPIDEVSNQLIEPEDVQIQEQYSPEVPRRQIPEIPPVQNITAPSAPQHFLKPIPQFEQRTAPRYTSARFSGFNDYPQCCLARRCPEGYSGFGDSVYAAYSQQIANGTDALMVLYNYDFYPLSVERETELTPRGVYQIRKIVDRLQYSNSYIKIQATGVADVDARRRENVIAALTDYGVPEQRVVLYYTNPGLSAAEMRLRGANYLDSVQLRGRTIQSSGSSGFSGSATFGQ